jgi:hypothetical protein
MSKNSAVWVVVEWVLRKLFRVRSRNRKTPFKIHQGGWQAQPWL